MGLAPMGWGRRPRGDSGSGAERRSGSALALRCARANAASYGIAACGPIAQIGAVPCGDGDCTAASPSTDSLLWSSLTSRASIRLGRFVAGPLPSPGSLLGSQCGDTLAGCVHAVWAPAKLLKGLPSTQVSKMAADNLGPTPFHTPEERDAVVACHLIFLSRLALPERCLPQRLRGTGLEVKPESPQVTRLPLPAHSWLFGQLHKSTTLAHGAADAR